MKTWCWPRRPLNTPPLLLCSTSFSLAARRLLMSSCLLISYSSAFMDGDDVFTFPLLLTRSLVLVALDTTAADSDEVELLCPAPSLELALGGGLVAESATIV